MLKLSTELSASYKYMLIFVKLIAMPVLYYSEH